MLPWRLSALVLRYFWTLSPSAFLVQRSPQLCRPALLEPYHLLPCFCTCLHLLLSPICSLRVRSQTWPLNLGSRLTGPLATFGAASFFGHAFCWTLPTAKLFICIIYAVFNCVSNSDHISQPFSGGIVFYIFPHHITHPHSRASIFFFTWPTVYNNYCSLLGGYGARTHGVCQHLTLNGTLIISYRPMSMPSATMRRCRPSRCGRRDHAARYDVAMPTNRRCGLCGHASPPLRGKCRRHVDAVRFCRQCFTSFAREMPTTRRC